MSDSIVVFGAGPGLGQAVARRYAAAGYSVVLVGRGSDRLEQLAKELIGEGASAHALVADLSDTATVPELAERIRAAVGDPGVLFYGVPAGGFVPVLDLTARQAQDLMPMAVYTLLELVREFLPAMLANGGGAIISAQGASALQGNPAIAGGFVLAAQRNYLQALHAEVAGKGVQVGGLYIGAAIERSAWHAELERAKAAGEQVWETPSVDPAHLAELVWTMHHDPQQSEVIYT